MPHRRPPRSLAVAFLLGTLVVAGCSDAHEDSTSGEPAAGSTAAVSSSPSLPSPSPSPSSHLQSSPSPRPSAAPPFIASATWGDSNLGVTLKVAPTPSARRATGPDDAAIAWAEVLRLAPDAQTPGMREQFDCHWRWARLLEPDKQTWNIEPWRPVVAAETMVLEGCNPGGPEV